MTTLYRDLTTEFERRRTELPADPETKLRFFREFVNWLEDPTLHLQAARADLIRRIVPVAISIGFAGSLATMSWLRDGHKPVDLEWQQIARLLSGMVVILLGWDWYHRDLILHPATSIVRFFVDVLVVTASLMFLISAQHEILWFVFLAIIFWLYVLWDVVNIIENSALPNLVSQLFRDFGSVWQQYKDGTRNGRKVLDPIINVLWATYFSLLTYLVYHSSTKVWWYGIVLAGFVAFSTLIIWLSGRHQQPGRSRWPFWAKVLSMVVLVEVAFALERFGPEAAPVSALNLSDAKISNGRLVISGQIGQPSETVSIGNDQTKSDRNGDFEFELTYLPETCRVTVRYGLSAQEAVIANCGPKGTPGAPGQRGADGAQGIPGVPGDSEFFDAKAQSAELCGLQIKCREGDCKTATSPLMIAPVPHSWRPEACENLFSGYDRTSHRVVLGCVYKNRPFVAWIDRVGPGSGQSPNCGW